MPQLQTVDLSAIPRREPTNLESLLSGFSERHSQNRQDEYETDALRDIYDQYRQDGNLLEDAIMAVQTRPGLSPTTRLNSINQLLNFQKHNQALQKGAQADMKAREKQESNKKILDDIEKRRNIPEGELSPYINDPKMAEQLTRPAKELKKTEASQPIDEDQLRRIQHVRNQPGFKEASPAKKYQMLTDSGVSRANAKAESDIFAEEDKLKNERSSVVAKEQAKRDVNFYNEQVESLPRIFRTQETIDNASKINEEGASGSLWDQAMQYAGLLQFTSEGYRQFASYAKEMVKNQNIRNIVGSQISQMEFGFFRDATISERFSKEANRQILRKEQAALRYEKLYADITKSIVEQNNGQIPPNLQQQVNEQFAAQSPKITKEVKEAAIDYDAIQNIPKGKVLMFDKKRRPLHVPANQVEKYMKLGASLS